MNEIFQAPSCWSELPDKILLKVFQNLKVTSVNNVHLVCKKFHEIANVLVNPELSFDQYSEEHLESLCKSSRIFQELTFYKGCTDYLSSPKKFSVLQKYLDFTGPHIKKLVIEDLEDDPSIVLKFLSLLPNLEKLEGHFEGSTEYIRGMKPIAPNLSSLVIHDASSDTLDALLETLDNLKSVKIPSGRWKMGGKVYPKIKHLEATCTFDVQNSAERLTKQFPNLEYLWISFHQIHLTDSFFTTLLSGLKRLKLLDMWISHQSEVDPKSILEFFQEHGNHLLEADIFFEFPNSETAVDFTIKKLPGGSFCIT
jgi:hypothetical protein